MARSVDILTDGTRVHYVRYADWPEGTWLVYRMTGEALSRDTCAGIIHRSPIPGRSSGSLWNDRTSRKLAAEALVERLRIMSNEQRPPSIADQEPVHVFFGLSYAQYLAIPRSVLQSMPVVWQRSFVEHLQLLDETIDWRPPTGQCYRVQLYETGEADSDDPDVYWKRPVEDPLADYERGRRRLPVTTPLPVPQDEADVYTAATIASIRIALFEFHQKLRNREHYVKAAGAFIDECDSLLNPARAQPNEPEESHADATTA